MKKELDYFYVENDYGFDQDKFSNLIMRGGGCAAVTACDCCIYFKKYFGIDSLYPKDANSVTLKDYKAFSNVMKPFLHPRITGIDKLEIYIDGFNSYLQSVGENRLFLSPFESSNSLEDAKQIIKKTIDKNYPVPYLLLKHKNPMLKDFVWHWFILSGYEEFEDTFMVKIVSYGKWLWFDFNDLYSTGYADGGGMILFDVRQTLCDK